MSDVLLRPIESEKGLTASQISNPGNPVRDIVPIVLRHKFVIMAAIAFTLIVAIVATLLATPYYRATARIEISRTQSNITNVQALNQDDNRQNLEFYRTQYALLQSRTLAERVERTLNLSTDPLWLATSPTPAESTQPKRVGDRQQDERQRAVATLMRVVQINPIEGSALVDVVVNTPNPQLSARIANEWVTQFIGSNLGRRLDSTAYAREFLGGRLRQLRQRTETSERALVNYARSRQIITFESAEGPEGKGRSERTLVSDNLSRLNEALAQATTDLVQAESRLNQAGGGLNDGNSATLSSLRQERAQALAEYRALLVRFDPQYPDAKIVKARVDALDASIAREAARISGGVAGDFEAAQKREKRLRTLLVEERSRFLDQRSDSIQYNILAREVDTNKQLYDSLLQRFKEIDVTGVGVNNVSIVDAARVPESASSPKLMTNLAIALLGGIAVATLLVMLLERSDDRIKHPIDVATKLGVPLLGVVPFVAKGRAIEEISDPKSGISESFISLVSTLGFATAHGIPRTMMLTSAQPSEGKSVSCIGLAQVMSRVGKRVLLIDVDLRRPSLHRSLGLNHNRGMTNLLAGEEDWRSFVQHTDRGFDFISAGPIPPNSAELLTGGRMEHLLLALQAEYDCVIVDAPPVMGLADAPLLGQLVEGVLLTVSFSNARVPGIQSAMTRLQLVEAKILGAVLTQYKREALAQTDSYSYSYEYAEKVAS